MTSLEFTAVIIVGWVLGFGTGVWFALKFRDNKH